MLGADKELALAIGISLFGLRIINTIDASVKFPDRCIEIKQSGLSSWQTKDYRELMRLVLIAFGSIGYSLSTTDAIYSTTQKMASWMNLDSTIAQTLSYSSAALGAAGTLPLVVYWSLRGLRQLTYGGKLGAHGENPDPTDKYTYLGLVLVFPVMLGLLGGATASTGAMFGQLGTFADVIRIVTSIMYAACAGTPGMATLLRNCAHTLNKLFAKNYTTLNDSETQPLLSDDTENTNTVINLNPESIETRTNTSSLGSFFSRRTKQQHQPSSTNEVNKREMCTIS